MSEEFNLQDDLNFREQVFGTILSIREALRQINEEEEFEISESLNEIDDSLKELDKFF